MSEELDENLAEATEAAQAQQLPAPPSGEEKGIAKLGNTAWRDSLALDVALNEAGSGASAEEILEIYELRAEELQEILKDPIFKERMEFYKSELDNSGLSFKLKAHAQAELYLEKIHEMVYDSTVDNKIKADLMKSVVRWAGYEPKTGEGEGGGGGGAKITINLMPPMSGGGEPKTVIEGEFTALGKEADGDST